jgi:hypothetical protein
MKKLLSILGVLGFVVVGVGCDDPCGDLQECCDALYASAGGCPVNYEDQDADACDAAMDQMDQYASLTGQALPEECE